MEKLDKENILLSMQKAAEESFAKTNNPAFTSTLSFYVYNLRRIFEEIGENTEQIPAELYNQLAIIHNEITEVLEQPSESKSIAYIISEEGKQNLQWLNHQFGMQSNIEAQN